MPNASVLNSHKFTQKHSSIQHPESLIGFISPFQHWANAIKSWVEGGDSIAFLPSEETAKTAQTAQNHLPIKVSRIFVGSISISDDLHALDHKIN